MSSELSQETVQLPIENAAHLVRFGSCAFDKRSGWTFEENLLSLWGVAEVSSPIEVIDCLVLPEDREGMRAAMWALGSRGGHRALDYRVRDPLSGGVRHIHCTCDVVVGADGSLIKAVATHVEVTGIMQARAEADRVLAESRVQRALVLRSVSDLLASTSHGVAGAMQNTAELAAGALGDGCALHVLSADLQHIEVAAVAHRHEQGRRRLAGLLAAHPAPLADAAPLFRDVFNTGALRLGEGDAEVAGMPWAVSAHYVIAPIRFDGSVLGFLSLYRPSSDTAYEQAEADLVQVLADRVGATIDSGRSRKMVARQLVDRRASDARLQAMTSDQRELVVQLDHTESRERDLLANAIHDEPLQLIVAAMLRLDNLRDQLPVQAADQLENIAAMLEQSVEKLRTLIVALAPPDLRWGLRVALERFAEAIFVDSGTVVEVVGPTHVPLGSDATVTVYRIAREALVNAHKHAKAAHVTIELREKGGSVGLRVTDDGIGIVNLDAGPGHLGLASMRARASASNVMLVIESTVGHGTVVDLRLPAQITDADASDGTGSIVSSDVGIDVRS
jgi:signal transduction histidine kinase